MRKIFLVIIFIFILLAPKNVYATYNPESTANNKYGIHILFPDELNQAANLVNSSGGDWGYVTIPIQDSDRNLDKWQKFMDDCRKFHLIPIVRIATEGDYFIKSSWKIPNKYYVIDFANFLNSLNWPTKNRYVVVFNEENRGDEWGGTPDPAAYADILNYAEDVFKERNSDFFILLGGLDNAAPNLPGQYINELEYIKEMENSNPGVFNKLDGIAAHAYPNPAFSSPASYTGENGIYSFTYEKNLISQYTNKNLPIFITETGWDSTTINYSKQLEYYKQAFANAWGNADVIAVTPFLLSSDNSTFNKFAFIKNGQETELYKGIQGIVKVKGTPLLSPEINSDYGLGKIINIRNFNDTIKNTFSDVNKKTKIFFKWLLGL